ncbi:MAG: IS66 family insertion sequence element accessory protein TnpB [Opitutaceae bacterium]|nr:IS66 family insertion sequence element accessory protein TnpB [Opitutaceae bacterium]
MYEQHEFGGHCVAWLKRLEAGKFSWPVADRASLSLRNEEFGALVNGLEVSAKMNWYRE